MIEIKWYIALGGFVSMLTLALMFFNAISKSQWWKNKVDKVCEKQDDHEKRITMLEANMSNLILNFNAFQREMVKKLDKVLEDMEKLFRNMPKRSDNGEKYGR